MKDTITKEAFFNHPIDVVWRAITTAEELSSWFIPADFKAVKGYKYVFTSPPNDKGCSTIEGQVLEATPYTLIYTWTVGSTTTETIVTWELEPTGQGTKLTLKHSGISNYSGETALTMFDSFDGGWNNCINDLTNYINTLTQDAKQANTTI